MMPYWALSGWTTDSLALGETKPLAASTTAYIPAPAAAAIVSPCETGWLWQAPINTSRSDPAACFVGSVGIWVDWRAL